jgi:hypothetical protein
MESPNCFRVNLIFVPIRMLVADSGGRQKMCSTSGGQDHGDLFGRSLALQRSGKLAIQSFDAADMPTSHFAGLCLVVKWKAQSGAGMASSPDQKSNSVFLG